VIQRWLFPILIVAFIWLVFSRLGEIETLALTLTRGDWRWLGVAAAVQLLRYTIYAYLYCSSFDTLGVKSRVWHLLPITFAALFVNATAPTAGAAGVALFVDDAGRRGESKTRAAMGNLLVMVADLVSFVLILIVGLAVLITRDSLRWYESAAATILILYVSQLVLFLTLGLWRPAWLHTILTWIQRLVNRVGGWFRRPQLLVDDWGARNAVELTQAAHGMVASPLKLVRTLSVGLAVHLANLFCLYAVFQAFRQPVSFEVLVAGYAMMMLFWVVSPTPGGAGVVEGLMPVIFASLGVPISRATVISLAFRGLSFWIPLLVGFFLLRRLKLFTPSERSVAETGEGRLMAMLAALMGLINVLSGMMPGLTERLILLGQISPAGVHQGGQFISVVLGFALLMLARGLWRHKRAAWLLTLVVLIVSAFVHLGKGLDYEEASLAILLAIFLWTQRNHFQAVADPPSVWQGFRALLAAVAFTVGYGMLGFYLLSAHFAVDYTLDSALDQTLALFTQLGDPGVAAHTGYGSYFVSSVYGVAAITFFYVLWLLLRPLLLRRPAAEVERLRAQKIVDQYGRTSLARFALFPDKSYWFSPGGSLVAYTVHARMTVALDDPIGPPEDVADAISGFRTYCARKRRQAAFYKISPEYLDWYRDSDFNLVCIGHEGIIDLNRLPLNGTESGSPAASLERMNARGYRPEVHRPPITEPLLSELQAVSDEWLTAVHGREKRFDIGWFDEAYIRTNPVMTLCGPDGATLAFANLVIEPQQGEVAIDLLRYRRGAPDEVVEFLLAALLQWAREEGHSCFNLGLSPLVGVETQPDDPVAPQALLYIYDHASLFYNFRGLHEFKELFRPFWRPRYLAFPGYASLPAIGMTLRNASLGGTLFYEYASNLVPGAGTFDVRRAAAAKARAKEALSILDKSPVP
jgi:phosphatidylglycerol lysyltransferase